MTRPGTSRAATPSSLVCSGLLLDMDGVLIDSGSHAEEVWREWAIEHGLRSDVVSSFGHGRPVETVVAHFLRREVHERDVAQLHLRFRNRPTFAALPGAAELLAQHMLPLAVVTSAVTETAIDSLQAAGLTVPDIVVGADSVKHGKPRPDPYLTGAALLGLPAHRCIAIEDSPAGLESAVSAGAATIGLLTTHTEGDLDLADWVIRDLSGVRAERGRLAFLGSSDAGAWP